MPTPHLHIFEDVAALSHAAAKWIANYITTTLSKQNKCTVVLAGGSTPQKLYTLLCQSPYKEQIDWSKIHIFWGDERAVPFASELNNAKMSFDTLLNQVPIPAQQIHIIPTHLPPYEAANAYQKILQDYFKEDSVYTFDLVLLGMGDDGHTLPLFPTTDVVREKARWVAAFFLAAQDMYRITLTYPIVNKANAVVFLVAGSSKATALQAVLQGEANTDTYPAQTIKPANGQLHWFVDDAAAGKLK
jgi:6-phosphogluconolactonase